MNFGEPRGLDAEVFASLEDDGAEAEFDCLARACENLFARHAVARHGAGGAQAAVVALADAEAGDFDEAAQVDVVADVGAADRIGAGEELLEGGGVFFTQPVEEFCMGDSRHDALRAGQSGSTYG